MRVFIQRASAQLELQQALQRAPVVLLSGARQTGKSTLARQLVAPSQDNHFDLEDPRDRARLENPTLALSNKKGTVVIDEAQRAPDLFPVLRVLVDEDRRPGRFLVLGSASPDLIGLSSESLAGRVTLLELGGFRLEDLGRNQLDRLWQRGGFPESFLASSDALSNRWRDDYITTFLERDLALLGFRLPATTMRRFWTMLAHYHGQTWNGAELSRALAVSESTVRRYLDSLSDALVVRQLKPWFANIKKRQVRSPKVYIRDTGILHRLLEIDNERDLFRHPKVGASWEGMVVEQLLALSGSENAAFWGTHAGADLDLRLKLNGRLLGFEIKLTDAPSTTKSMHSALSDLALDHLYVVHRGDLTFPLTKTITAISAADLLTRSPAEF